MTTVNGVTCLWETNSNAQLYPFVNDWTRSFVKVLKFTQLLYIQNIPQNDEEQMWSELYQTNYWSSIHPKTIVDLIYQNCLTDKLVLLPIATS